MPRPTGSENESGSHLLLQGTLCSIAYAASLLYAQIGANMHAYGHASWLDEFAPWGAHACDARH